jgi:hypothetical protein
MPSRGIRCDLPADAGPRRWPALLVRSFRAARRRRREGWHWVEPADLRDGISIAELVSPLRYDVIVRRDFFELYAANRDLYQSERASFVELARRSSYYRWWIDSEAVWTRHDRRLDRAQLDVAFVDRVDRSIALYDSAERRGLRGRGVVLKTADLVLPPSAHQGGPPTGKIVSGQYFLADGCHRLALHMLQGQTMLLPHDFRVRHYERYSPFDSTSLLVPSLALSAEQYVEYLATRYTAPSRYSGIDDLVAHVRRNAPHHLEEVLSLLRVDGYLPGPQAPRAAALT